jgi:hypothetical protein
MLAAERYDRDIFLVAAAIWRTIVPAEGSLRRTIIVPD